jgi:hypothetical protein
MRILHRLAISIAVISALTARVHAQSAEAAALFDDGDKLLKQGKIAEACAAFESSNRIEARAGTLIRLGDCRERNNQLASAWSAYKDALARVKDPHKQKVARDRVAALEPRLSYLTLAVGKPVDGLAITRDGKPIDPGEWNRAIPIDGGSYEIAASASGFEPWQTTTSVPAERGTITVTVPKLVEQAKPAPPTTATPVATTRPPEPAAEPAGIFTTRREVAVGVLGVGVVAGVVGIVLGVSAKHDQDDAYALCPSVSSPCASADRANSLISTGHTRAFEADAAFGVAAVGAIVAGALWFTGAPERRVDVAVDPAHRGVVVMGRF